MASRKTAAKETTFSATFPSNQRVLTDAGVLNKHESIPLFKYFSYDSKLHVDHSVDGLLLKKNECCKLHDLASPVNQEMNFI